MTHKTASLPRWMRLDNAAKIYPAARRKNWSNVFRQSVTLLYYVRRGRLYIIGGMLIALGGFAPLIVFLMSITFDMRFIGWSVYPLVVLVLFGGLLIYLAISRPTREILKKKVFLLSTRRLPVNVFL